VSGAGRVVVAGAGAFGSAIALELARGGADVVLADPAEVGDNASGVAAGMLAPAFEALLDAQCADHFPLLAEARDLWTAFAAPFGEAAFGLRRDGAVWLTLPEDPPALIEQRRAGLQALGAACAPYAAAELAGLAADVAGAPALFTPEDWRLEPQSALDALRAAAGSAGARLVRAEVVAFEPGRVRLSSGETLAADHLVVATGAEASALAPELGVLSPIKGHILGYPGLAGLAEAPVLRCRLGYAVGGAHRLSIGASMEPGLADRAIDPAVVLRLSDLAGALVPALAGARPTPRAAVRAATPDALPLVGPSERPGVILAVGARRNGWLLAPLVARMTAAYLAGRDLGPHAARLDARRFAPA